MKTYPLADGVINHHDENLIPVLVGINYMLERVNKSDVEYTSALPIKVMHSDCGGATVEIAKLRSGYGLYVISPKIAAERRCFHVVNLLYEALIVAKRFLCTG